MKKTAEKIKNYLTNLQIDSIKDNEAALAVFQTLLTAVEADEVGDVFKLPNIQSEHDRRVQKLLGERQGVFESEKSSLLSQLDAIKLQLPRESDPQKIKSQLDATTDPTERRLLQLEYNNALSQSELSKMQAEKTRLESENKQNALRTRLSEIATNEKLSIHDPSLFVQYGDKAEETMKSYAEKNKAFIESEIAKAATERFGGGTQQAGQSTKSKMTLEEIEALPNREAVAKAMVDNGYLD